jgi:3-dehydroquinate synthase
LVLIDPVFLETLPLREIRSGLAEVIKYGVISDSDLFNKLESKNIDELTTEDMTEIIARCATIKARYVERDEFDRMGVRAALNLGHTMGHVVETLTDHTVNHGEGVAVGMVAAGYIANEHGLLSYDDYNRIINLIEGYGLQIKLPALDVSEALAVMHRDKKAMNGEIKFILPTGIGTQPATRKVGDETIAKVLEVLVE